jgi:AcrR family transcriptional regulator
MDLYARDGHKGLTVHAVMAASGVSSGSLYHHFGSIDGLAAALFSRCMSDLLQAVAAALHRSRTARAGIHAMVVAILDHARDHPAAARLIHTSQEFNFLPAHSARINTDKQANMHGIADWFAPHIAAGRIVDLPPIMIEMLVVGPAAETVRRWVYNPHTVDLEQAARVLPDRIWQSVRADPSNT